jgi:phage N-6-adenine-methyltransferase
MSAKLAPLFSKGTDDWETPAALFEELDREFHFTLDAAASAANHKHRRWFGPDHPCAHYHDATAIPWGDRLYQDESVWLNPPYSRVREFMEKAAAEAQNNRCTVVCLVPARTDTRWFHAHIWDERWQHTRPGVEVRFIKGRVKFGAATSGAPFPSMVVIFHRWA